jgi:hypothetical protein
LTLTPLPYLSLFQLHIKLKSSTNKEGPDTSSSTDGLCYDPYGYGCGLLHFLGLLGSGDFQRFVNDTREIVDSADEAQPLAKRHRPAVNEVLPADPDEESPDEASAS